LFRNLCIKVNLLADAVEDVAIALFQRGVGDGAARTVTQVFTALEDQRHCCYGYNMSTVEEIQTAIEKLSLSERGRIAEWFNGWEDDDWDKQMSKDFGPGGRYERVPDRVNDEIKRGPLTDLPRNQKHCHRFGSVLRSCLQKSKNSPGRNIGFGSRIRSTPRFSLRKFDLASGRSALLRSIAPSVRKVVM
jgi:hypothetical protein